jgi:hypothetical protein
MFFWVELYLYMLEHKSKIKIIVSWNLGQNQDT